MPALTPEYLMDLESRMTIIRDDEFARLSENLNWTSFVKAKTSTSRKELLTWMLSTATIEPLGGQGGEMIFDDMLTKQTEYEHVYSGKGLKLGRQQFEDTDGAGAFLAGNWSTQIGSYMAYYPQKKAYEMLKNGHAAAALCYDGQPFFSKSHVLNPYRTELGTFANLFSGAAGSTPSTDPNDSGYPGAIVLDESVATDVALVNLAKAIAYIKSIKMPNGEDPRFLRPVALMGPPRMQTRLVQLTAAKTIAQAASAGGGSADVEAVIASFGFTKPIIADELAGFESDTTTFLICEQITASELGGLIFSMREPYKVVHYTGDGGQNVELARSNELEWHCRGRNVTAYGHPYLIYKLKAT